MATNQEEVLEKGRQLAKEAQEARAAARAFMDENGIVYPLHEWISMTNYAKKYNILDRDGKPDTSILINWIKRGNVPPEDVLELPELGGVRLVRDKPYR